MRLPCRSTGLLTLGLLLAASPLLAAPPKEVAKLHVLLVFDTQDDALSDSLEIDESRMRAFLRSTIPSHRLSVTVLKGEKVTREGILGHYRRARPGAEDGLLFFYGGHGATDPVKKHYFQLASGENLPRSEVRRAMEAKKTALVLLLTDCCSTPQRIKSTRERGKDIGPGARQIHPTVRCLLFQARGTVDVTAATDAPSWSDSLEGGLFTRTLCRMMQQDVKSLDTNGDGFVSWREFFPRLQRETEGTFKSWLVEMRSRGARLGTDTQRQRPASFALGNDDLAARSYAVVGIENGTMRTISYRYRWTGEQEWKDVSLEKGERRVHFVSLAEGQAALPDLEVEVGGRTMPSRKAGKWAGEGNPSFDDGRCYRLGSRKK